LIDLIVASFALVVLSPVFLVTAVLVVTRLGRPILFRQTRSGLDGRPFQMLKFRSMTDARDASGNLLSDAARIGRFGRWLRSSSLDELPELLNVLRGQMSLVGPRPLLMQYLPLYNSEQIRRHTAKPGISGWAQVNGRNALSWDEKFALDVWYVDNWRMWLDLKIMWLTVLTIVRRDGISAAGEATMPPFGGGTGT
jgi:lipopolysaccharide/colanic/teichoic acid biosynthesis glycosyltransferase